MRTHLSLTTGPPPPLRAPGRSGADRSDRLEHALVLSPNLGAMGGGSYLEAARPQARCSAERRHGGPRHEGGARAASPPRLGPRAAGASEARARGARFKRPREEPCALWWVVVVVVVRALTSNYLRLAPQNLGKYNRNVYAVLPHVIPHLSETTRREQGAGARQPSPQAPTREFPQRRWVSSTRSRGR